MIRSTLRLLALPLVLLSLAGCAGYRGGWESFPYIGPTAPAALPESVRGTAIRPPLELPGLKLEVSLDNRLRTYDTQVYLYALLLGVDLSNAYHRNNDPSKTRLFVYVTPTEAGFILRPSQAVLHVGEQRFTGAAGFESDRWNSAGERVQTGGVWQRRPTGPEFVLAEAGRKYYLAIDFDTAPPSPESTGIAVDLSRALLSPRQPPLPLIRFAPVRWKEGYT